MIGRKNEITTLDRLYNSNRAQFVAVYGRRGVGKTYLNRGINSRERAPLMFRGWK